MCGIGGVVSLEKDLNASEVQSVLRWKETLKHRGPDQQGDRQNRRVCFINTRLAIMDPRPKANLPMTSDDEKIWVSFNGEISIS